MSLEDAQLKQEATTMKNNISFGYGKIIPWREVKMAETPVHILSPHEKAILKEASTPIGQSIADKFIKTVKDTQKIIDGSITGKNTIARTIEEAKKIESTRKTSSPTKNHTEEVLQKTPEVNITKTEVSHTSIEVLPEIRATMTKYLEPPTSLNYELMNSILSNMRHDIRTKLQVPYNTRFFGEEIPVETAAKDIKKIFCNEMIMENKDLIDSEKKYLLKHIDHFLIINTGKNNTL